MSIYDHRDKPAYSSFKTEPHYSENRYILKWWTPAHDILLATQILQWQWVWYWGISDEIIKITSSTTIESWKNTDPLCSKYAWYNILMYFATARAEQLELTKTIRCPQRKICLLCTKEFVEDSLPMSLIGRLGTERVDFCAPCLKETILGEGNSFASEGDIFKYLHDVTNLIERVPSQSFGEGMTDLLDMQNDERLALLKLLQIKPSVTRVKSVFGSWLNALIQAGVLEDGTRKTSRGIQSIAKDGHVCLSLGERTIDDFLYSRGVHHEKEPRYPEGNYRGDFKVGNTFIEYFGLAGNLEYDEKTEEKIRLCKKHGITLIAIYPKDLISRKNLENKLLTLLTR